MPESSQSAFAAPSASTEASTMRMQGAVRIVQAPTAVVRPKGLLLQPLVDLSATQHEPDLRVAGIVPECICCAQRVTRGVIGAHSRCRTVNASPDRGGPPEVCQSIAKGGEELPASAVSLQPVSSFTAADQETTQSCTRQARKRAIKKWTATGQQARAWSKGPALPPDATAESQSWWPPR